MPILIILLTACSVKKHYLGEGRYLLIKNKINFQDKPSSPISQDEISYIIKQRGNASILGIFRPYMWFYIMGSKGDTTTKFKRWLRNIGEEPVVFDTLAMKKSVEQISTFLKQKGYARAFVNANPIFKKHKVIVTYNVKFDKPYKVKDISIILVDTTLSLESKQINSGSLLRRGMLLDKDILIAERDRWAYEMRNLGYYNFSQDYIEYYIDTTGTFYDKSLDGYPVSLDIVIKKYSTYINTDTGIVLTQKPHEKFFIEGITVMEENANQNILDTVENAKGVKVIIGEDSRIRPTLFFDNIFIKKKMPFQISAVTNTHSRLMSTGLFKFVKMTFDVDTSFPYPALNAFITTQLLPIHTLAWEIYGTNRGGNLGGALSLSYSNKNIFRGGEQFSIGMKGMLEVQRTKIEEKRIIEAKGIARHLLPFNVFEFSPNVSLKIPRLLLPRFMYRRIAVFPNNTEITINYSFMKTPDYIRTLMSGSMKYYYQTAHSIAHTFTLLDLNSVKIVDMSEKFREVLNKQNPLYRRAFEDVFLQTIGYAFSYLKRRGREFFNTYSLNSSFEIGGLFPFYIYHKYIRNQNPPFQIFGITYATYFKATIESKWFYTLTKHTFVAYRLTSGIGIPFGNIPVLPFEKAFYGGGVNSLRGWLEKTVGPGGYPDSLKIKSGFYQYGDIYLEGNAEYRFDVIGSLKMAIFGDAGNIWLIKKDTARPNAELYLKSYNDIYIAGGIGFRWDMTFFIIRLDIGFPFYDPSLPESEKFIWQKKVIYKQKRIENGMSPKYNYVKVNFGIGYPF